MLELTSICTN